ncbi:MAG: hypothetical protein AAGH76_16945 [Pseudomonadota bacterium]
MTRYALGVLVVLVVVLGNSYVVGEFDWYEAYSQITAGLLHDLAVWFVACFMGGFIARRGFMIAAAVLSSLTVLAWIDLMNRFVFSITVPADPATWHLVGIVVAAVGGAVIGEATGRFREPRRYSLSDVA